MKNELDSHMILQVFESVLLHGKEVDGKHELDGISVYSHPDGYTIYIEDVFVKMRVGFHNKYHLEYDKPEHFETFKNRLHAIHDKFK